MTDIIVDKPACPKARILLAHGAGAASTSLFMQLLATKLVALDIEVWRFNFGYMQRFINTGKRSLPEKLLVLQQQFTEQIDNVMADLPLFIAGKSMGGRVASMLTEHSGVRAVFAFGYPFHPPKKPCWRTEHFSSLNCPLFIAQGERDLFGSRAELSNQVWSQVEICWLTDGDHDFKPRVRSGLTQQQLITQAAQFCSRKIDEILLAS